jgi:hypothetical protein
MIETKFELGDMVWMVDYRTIKIMKGKQCKCCGEPAPIFQVEWICMKKPGKIVQMYARKYFQINGKARIASESYVIQYCDKGHRNIAHSAFPECLFKHYDDAMRYCAKKNAEEKAKSKESR